MSARPSEEAMEIGEIHRILSKISESATEHGCREWLAAVNDSGYGIYGYNGSSRLAHRYVYELRYGPIPTGLFVLHRCDNRRCCEPSHLFLGTNNDNVRDMVLKGRSARSQGERNGMAKLTAKAVEEIRSRHGKNGDTYTTLAREYGVSRMAVKDAVSGATWRHVPAALRSTPNTGG